MDRPSAAPEPGHTPHVDVLIVGAGLSGIGAAVHLTKKCPGKSFVLLEGRAAIGGTWDLFRYPGIRSDSDMYTLGYDFKPWTAAKAIADGPSILAYVRETAAEHGIDQHIHFQHEVERADWSNQTARWTIEARRTDTGETVRYTCNFLFLCGGYYSYKGGYLPEWPGYETFKGRLVHPQNWTPDIDHAGKRVVVIGSGATAVTLVPELAKTAEHVVMLQRSPTYMASRPSADGFANALRRYLPSRMAYGLTRWKNVLLGMWFYNLTRRRPAQVKEHLIKLVREKLPAGYDVSTHFTPRYNPWDQRLCLVPDGDLFESITAGKAEVVTGTIERFTEKGIQLSSGRHLDADIIVTATGLVLEVWNGISVSVDGAPVEAAKALAYKGMMYEGVPNLISFFGYTNASWTLKADLTADYVCRLIRTMDAKGMTKAVPVNTGNDVMPEPWLDFSSGYVQRAMARFPKQGNKTPWRLHQNYARDLMALRFGRLEDGVLQLSRPAARAASAAEPAFKAAAE